MIAVIFEAQPHAIIRDHRQHGLVRRHPFALLEEHVLHAPGRWRHRRKVRQPRSSSRQSRLRLPHTLFSRFTLIRASAKLRRLQLLLDRPYIRPRRIARRNRLIERGLRCRACLGQRPHPGQ